MQDLNDLYYFAAVVDHGGFAAAERALGIPKSRLSRRISALETELGVRLLQRSTRRFAVTDVGTSVHRHAQSMLAEAQAAREGSAYRCRWRSSSSRSCCRTSWRCTRRCACS
jgi:DNA-binding transcriptional LysR family regulator